MAAEPALDRFLTASGPLPGKDRIGDEPVSFSPQDDFSVSGAAATPDIHLRDHAILFRNDPDSPSHWSVPWSDLMMTMFVLFAVLYAFHASKPEPAAADPQPQASSMVSAVVRPAADTSGREMEQLYDMSRQAMLEDDLQKFASVDLVPDKAVRIVLTGDLLFDTGKVDIKPKALDSLRQVGALLARTPYVINVVGHTDDQPIHTGQFPSNWELSSARACQVARFLIEEIGLPAERFYVSGHASYQPVGPNTDSVSQARNRRVEIIITREHPQGVNVMHTKAGQDAPAYLTALNG